MNRLRIPVIGLDAQWGAGTRVERKYETIVYQSPVTAVDVLLFINGVLLLVNIFGLARIFRLL